MLLYNQNIGYSEPAFAYSGTLIITIEGISNPITVNNIYVITLTSEDDSNATTIGVTSIDYAPSGIITVSAPIQQLAIISQAITNSAYSGEISIQLI
jgi:hypothetical protein